MLQLVIRLFHYEQLSCWVQHAFYEHLRSIYYIFLKLVNPDIPQGMASIHVLVLFGIGLNSIFLGIIGEYLLRIYLILRSEPVAIIEKSLNIDPEDLKL